MATSKTSDRVIITPDTLTINDHGNNELVTAAGAASDAKAELIGLTTHELLTAMLMELKVMNCHLTEMTGCEINPEDVDS